MDMLDDNKILNLEPIRRHTPGFVFRMEVEGAATIPYSKPNRSLVSYVRLETLQMSIVKPEMHTQTPAIETNRRRHYYKLSLTNKRS